MISVPLLRDWVDGVEVTPGQPREIEVLTTVY